jgi:lipopolysaccharide transport system ATP-binding protein
MDPVVSLTGVSKRFIIQPERPRSFLEHFLSLPYWFRRQRADSDKREFWAVRDVSFEVPRGQLVTLIGSNGSGKSTTLKLIAGILRPTAGSMVICGRLAAMLELGTGFHPDLTGRENIFLSGAILGLSTSEIRSIVNDIVEFADIGDFIGVPVRNYSSGMYVRLGFAVASHVHADILLIDEVLAVGDQAFQKKCIAKIQNLRRNGTTIIFVTHHLELARSLSDRVIWFRDGKIAMDDQPEVVLPEYLVYQSSCARFSGDNAPISSGDIRYPGSDAYFEAVTILDRDEQPRQRFRTGEPLTIRLHYVTRLTVNDPVFGLAIFRDDGLRLNGPNTGLAGFDIKSINGRGHVDYHLPELPLLTGRYYVTAGLFDRSGSITYDYGDNLATFEVIPSERTDMHGIVHLNAQWKHQPDNLFQ